MSEGMTYDEMAYSELVDACEEKDARIAELEDENGRLQGDGMHTCHDNCPRLACVQRRRIAELEGKIEFLQDITEKSVRGIIKRQNFETPDAWE
jgi:hypothetical protein